MTLHCLYHAPDTPAARRLLAQLSCDDAVLLLGEAVLLATQEGQLDAWLRSGATLHALDEDLRAHGVDAPHPAVRPTDFRGWVALSEVHPTQMLWR